MKGGTVQISWHNGKAILTIDFHPGTTTFATAGADHSIKFWSIKPAKTVDKLPVVSYLSNLTRHTTPVNVIRFSPSGEFLASGADEGEMIIWQLHSTDTGPTWKVFKLLGIRSHLKDILDLQWSTEATYIITGSVDNCCIIWDVKKGTNLQILDAHAHYVQGVAWDPLGEYVSSLSSDRTCRIYANKPHKSRGIEKINYVCERVISKADKPFLKNSKDTKFHLFHDDTLPSFFRRLAWSPDGLFLLVPAGSYKINTASETVNAAYIISRRDLSRPAIQLPCANKAVVAVRFCPIFFKLNATNSHTTADRFFNLPYRIIFAVATLNSLYIYDTESKFPLAVFAGLHYAPITDITWSSDGHYVALSSQDGFCSLVEFENNELGSPYTLSEVKVSKKDSKTTVQTAKDTVTVLARNISAVLAESKKMESEGKAGDMVTESSGNIGAAITKNKRTVIQEKPGNMVIEATGNVEGIIADSRKKRAREKTDDMITETDDMIIETTGTIGTAELDRRKAESEDMAAKQPASPDSDGKQSEATEKAGQNKPAKKRITPTVIDP